MRLTHGMKAVCILRGQRVCMHAKMKLIIYENQIGLISCREMWKLVVPGRKVSKLGRGPAQCFVFDVWQGLLYSAKCIRAVGGFICFECEFVMKNDCV